MKRAGFLYNGPSPELARSNEFDVSEGAVRLTAKTTGGFKLETAIGVGTTLDWVPLYRYGTQVELSPANVQHVELIPGRYRVIANGTEEEHADDLVYFEEDELLSNDKRVALMHTQAFV